MKWGEIIDLPGPELPSLCKSLFPRPPPKKDENWGHPRPRQKGLRPLCTPLWSSRRDFYMALSCYLALLSYDMKNGTLFQNIKIILCQKNQGIGNERKRKYTKTHSIVYRPLYCAERRTGLLAGRGSAAGNYKYTQQPPLSS